MGNLEDWYRLVEKTFDKGQKPYVALVGNKSDLQHMRAVKAEKHNQFADENDMYSYQMSAKTGDQVNSCFYRIAADLAGVVLTKPEIEVSAQVVAAPIIKYQQHDPDVKGVNPRKSGGKCAIQ